MASWRRQCKVLLTSAVLIRRSTLAAMLAEAKLLETKVNRCSLDLFLDTGSTGMVIWKFVAAPKPGVLVVCYPGVSRMWLRC